MLGGQVRHVARCRIRSKLMYQAFAVVLECLSAPGVWPATRRMGGTGSKRELTVSLLARPSLSHSPPERNGGTEPCLSAYFSLPPHRMFALPRACCGANQARPSG